MKTEIHSLRNLIVKTTGRIPALVFAGASLTARAVGTFVKPGVSIHRHQLFSAIKALLTIYSTLLLSACVSEGSEPFFKPVYFELHPVYPNR